MHTYTPTYPFRGPVNTVRASPVALLHVYVEVCDQLAMPDQRLFPSIADCMAVAQPTAECRACPYSGNQWYLPSLQPLHWLAYARLLRYVRWTKNVGFNDRHVGEVLDRVQSSLLLQIHEYTHSSSVHVYKSTIVLSSVPGKLRVVCKH